MQTSCAVLMCFLAVINAGQVTAETDNVFLSPVDPFQTEVYGPSSIVQSWVTDENDLYARFYNTLFPKPTQDVFIMKNVTKPYTIFQTGDRVLKVLSKAPDCLALLSITSQTNERLALDIGEKVRYDYAENDLYILSNGALTVRKFPSLEVKKEEILGNVADFYVSQGKLHLCEAKCNHFQLNKYSEKTELKSFLIFSAVFFVVFVLVCAFLCAFLETKP